MCRICLLNLIDHMSSRCTLSLRCFSALYGVYKAPLCSKVAAGGGTRPIHANVDFDRHISRAHCKSHGKASSDHIGVRAAAVGIKSGPRELIRGCIRSSDHLQVLALGSRTPYELLFEAAFEALITLQVLALGSRAPYELWAGRWVQSSILRSGSFFFCGFLRDDHTS